MSKFTEEQKEWADRVAKRLLGITPSDEWIKEYAERMDVSPEELLERAKQYIEHGDYWCEGGKFEGEYLPDGFWDHFEVITKVKVEEEKRGSFYTCSC